MTKTLSQRIKNWKNTSYIQTEQEKRRKFKDYPINQQKNYSLPRNYQNKIITKK